MSDSLVKRLFLGELPRELILPFPQLDPERREFMDMFRQSLARFAALKIDSRAIDKGHRIPPDVLDGLAELGLFGIRVPEEHGGLGLDMTQYVRIGADLAVLDGAVAIMSGGHSTIGIKALLLYGSAEQQARYLPRLATGELKAGFALSETGAGSDAQSLRCTAHRVCSRRSGSHAPRHRCRSTRSPRRHPARRSRRPCRAARRARAAG